MTISFGIEDTALDLGMLVSLRAKQFDIHVDVFDPSHCTVSCNNAENIAGLIADIIVENFQVRVLAGLINSTIDLPEKVRAEILVLTLKKLWFKDNKSITIESKQSVKDKVLAFLLDNQNYFTIDSFIRFRMRKELEEWTDTLGNVMSTVLNVK